jgi:hypothetical protein
LILRNLEDLLSLNEKPYFAGAAASSVSQTILPAGIKQLEEDMDVVIVRQPFRTICLSCDLLGDVP